MDLKVTLWNARGIKGKREEITERIKETDIAIITETKNRSMENLKVSGYNTILSNSRKNYKAEAGGIAIVIKKEIQWISLEGLVSQSENIEVAGIRIINVSQRINVVAIYRKPGKTEEMGTWKKIVKQVKSEPTDIILIARDFNSHHPAWNCTKLDTNGENLWEEMEDEDLLIVNRDTMSRIGEGGCRPSNLDLMFSSANFHHKIKYEQGKDTWRSGHFPIFFTTKIDLKIYRKVTNRISNTKTDWIVFRSEMIKKEELMENPEFRIKSEVERYNQIVEWIKEAVWHQGRMRERNKTEEI